MKILCFVLGCFVAGSIALTEKEWMDTIVDLNTKWGELFTAGDLTALTSMHSNDTINLPPEYPIIIGNAAYYEDLLHLQQSGDYARWRNLTSNRLVWHDDKNAITTHVSEAGEADGTYWLGKAMRTFRVEDNGEVKIVLSCWNADS